MLEALKEFREYLLQFGNVKFAETVDDLGQEDLPLMVIEIAKNLPHRAANQHSVFIMISIYANTLVDVIKLHDLFSQSMRFHSWGNIKNVVEFSGLDTGTMPIKSRNLIYGMTVYEVII